LILTTDYQSKYILVTTELLVLKLLNKRYEPFVAMLPELKPMMN